MENKRIQTWFFGALFLFLFIAVARIFTPFFTVILWSVLLYILFSPLYHRILKHIDRSRFWGRILRSLLAGIFSVVSVVAIVLPLGFVALQLARQVSILAKGALAFLESHPTFLDKELNDLATSVKELSLGSISLSASDLKQALAQGLSGGMQTVIKLSTLVLKNVGAFFLGLVFMVFSLFFFYMDGDYLLRLAISAVPIRNDYMKELVAKFRDITRNLFLGYILVALIQAFVAYIIFLLFRVEGALAFAIVLLFCTFVPMIGAGAVWGPIGLYRILMGDVSGGFIFLVVSGIFISTLDNLLRPLFLRDRIKLHPLVIFFSILGGITAFGFNGLILGPMVVILFLTVLNLFLLEHDIPHER